MVITKNFDMKVLSSKVTLTVDELCQSQLLSSSHVASYRVSCEKSVLWRCLPDSPCRIHRNLDTEFF